MNGILQIGIGLLPAVAALWFILVKRKAAGLKNVFCVLGMTAICLGTVAGGVAFGSGGARTEKQMSKEDMISFANALVENGGMDFASEVIDDYSDIYGYDEECSLLSARIFASQGDYIRANGIYQRLIADKKFSDRIKDEAELVKTKCEQNEIDNTLADYITEIGEDPAEYGIKSYDESDKVTSGQVLEAVLAGINKDNEKADETIVDCAAYAVTAGEYYSNFFDDDSDISRSDVKKLIKKMNSAGENEDSVFSLDVMRMARLKMLVLSGEYGEIAGKINNNASYDELIIATELYVSDKVDEDDFSTDYSEISENDVEKVLEKVKKVSDKLSEDMSGKERKDLDERVEAIEKQLEAPSLSKVKGELEEKAESEAGTDKSKVYLSVAKIDNYFGNEQASETNINKAIYNSPDCEDSDYTVPMSQIISVIDNDGTTDTEDIKNVSEYVEAVLDNSTTIGKLDLQAGSDSEEQQNQEQTETGESSVSDKFSDTMTDYVSKIKSVISIGKINTDEFDTISAQVQIASEFADTPEKLKKVLSVYDCGVRIEDYTIEKLDFDCSNIMLICDVSGSMSDSIESLKTAVSEFVSNKTEDENIAVVKFESSVTGEADFSSTDEQLQNFISNMSAGGGTAIYSTTYNKLEEFNGSEKSNDIFIVMTDGEDGDYADGEMIAELGELARSKGVTLYTLGLGSSVNTDYLLSIANAGNGDFVYVSDATSLEKFYDMLHEQLANQYLITYTARDTFTSYGRTLEVAIREENIKDVKTYNLESYFDNPDGTVNVLPIVGTVHGLSTRFIIKGNADTSNSLIGTGFKEDVNATLELKGNIDYNIELTYVSDTEYSLTVPATIAVGTYDVEVTLNGRRVVIENGLTVANPGSEKKLEFGPYVFTAIEIAEQSGGSYLLRGNVAMNGWLKFKDDLVITGDVKNGGSVRVSDYGGSYITYDKSTAVGVGAFFAEYGISADIPALGDFTLYNDGNTEENYENYLVDDITPGLMKIFNLINVSNVSVNLYPDKITGNLKSGSTAFPGQSTIFKCLTDSDIFKFEVDEKIVFTDKNIGLKMKREVDNIVDTVNYIRGTMMNAPVNFAADGLKYDIDTIKNEYSFGFMLTLGWFDTELGADVSMKDGLGFSKIDGFVIHVDHDFTHPIGGIPITFSDFSFGAENIQEAVQNNNFGNVTFKAGLSISAVKLSAIAPGISKVIGDFSLLSLDETEFKLRIEPFMMSAKTELKFLGDIKLAESELEYGTFDYTNLILGIENEETKGFRAMLSAGLVWEGSNCNVNITGTGELSVHSKFTGVKYQGTGKFDIQWWILNYEVSKEGEVTLGLQTTQSGQKQFVLAIREIKSNGKVKKTMYTLDA